MVAGANVPGMAVAGASKARIRLTTCSDKEPGTVELNVFHFSAKVGE